VTITRGRLRVYLGAASGVGKTYAMLTEGRRRAARGSDVVVGCADPHDRPQTASLLEGLEVLPPAVLDHAGARFEELDVAALLARAPQVVLIDELAHHNAPGSRNATRAQDVEQVLRAGIEVFTTLDVDQLESLGDLVSSITGLRPSETVPDVVVRAADQVELVDLSPQALRRRLAHGNVYPAGSVDAALVTTFRIGTLTALRELALLWMAGRVDGAMDGRPGCSGGRPDIVAWSPWERIVVAVSGGSEGSDLLRRGAQIARRAGSGELLAVHVTRSERLADPGDDPLSRLRLLVERLGGTFHSVVGQDVASAVLDFARGVAATQLVVGSGRRGRLVAALAPGVGARVAQRSGELDVHLIGHRAAGLGSRRRPGRANVLGPRRTQAGWVLGLVGPPALTMALVGHRQAVGLPSVLLVFLSLTVGVALVGGLWPALAAALACGLLANYVFTPPVGSWAIEQPENALAIGVLLAVATAVSAVVDVAARRTVLAAQARAEADTLTVLAGSVLRGDDAVPGLMDRLRETVGQHSVALLEHTPEGWAVRGSAGDAAPHEPGRADTVVPLRDGLVLALHGPRLSAGDLRLVTAVGAQADTLLERDRLRAEAIAARTERERTAMRTALLAAVSHDLRTPLAGIKAAVGTLRAEDLDLAAEDEAELLGAVEESADRLQSLIDNLLDMSRLDAGVVSAVRVPVALDEVVPRALATIDSRRVVVDVPEDLPLVSADAGLLERAVANIVENALRHSPAGMSVLVSARALRGRAVLRVVDQGPGVKDADKQRIFRAFQRLGDAPGGQGVGLGLAVARGFVEANRGTLLAEDTPGGGLTMVLSLPPESESESLGAAR
jgi:two-component system sensor histidine kinase KdpD